MKRARRTRLTVLLLSMMALAPWTRPAHAADREPSGNETWIEISTRAKIARRTQLTMALNLRWAESRGWAKSLGQNNKLIAPEVSVRRRLASWWRMETGYRCLYKRNNDDVFKDRHRIFTNTRFRAKNKLAALELRIQWQKEFRDELDNGTPQRHFLRTRAKASLRIFDEVTPFVSAEIYHRLDGNDARYPEGTLTKLRASAGAGWQVGRWDVGARYMLVVPIKEDTDPLTHVVGLELLFPS